MTIQVILSRKHIKLGILFILINSLFLLWQIADIETFTIAKTHFSLKYIFELLRLKQLFAEAAFTAGKNTVSLLANIIYLMLLPFAVLTIKSKQSNELSTRKLFRFTFSLIIIFVAHYVSFSYCCNNLPLYKYLPLRLDLGTLPIPDHPALMKNDDLRKVLQTKYVVDIKKAYSEPRFEFSKKTSENNIVFILIESLRYDVFRDYMPKLNKFANNGLNMTNNYSLSNITMSSLYSIFHSNFPIDVALTSKPEEKSNFEISIEKAGYKTYFVKSVPANFFKGQNTITVNRENKYDDTPLILSKTLDILKNNKKCTIFSYIYNTHFNYNYPSNFEKLIPVSSPDTNPLFLEPSKENIQKNRNRYINAASYADNCLGKFFTKIKELGLDKNTIFVVFGDHGESLGESGFFAHATGPHKVQFHTPLVIFGGPIKKLIVDYPTCHIDILPTLADIMNFKISNCHGKSLLKQQSYPIINLDESVSGRLIVRREKSMSLFDVKENNQLKWLATLNNDYSLTPETLSLYRISGLSKLAERIKEDATFIIKNIEFTN